MEPWKQICCAIDFSPASDQALRTAAWLSRQLGAGLVLLHVANAMDEGPLDLLRAPPDVLQAELAEHEAAMARRQDVAVKIREGEVGTAVVFGGGVAERICEHVAGHRYDALVVGSHGRRGMRRALLGSVAERVARLASCPVLIVRQHEER